MARLDIDIGLVEPVEKDEAVGACIDAPVWLCTVTTIGIVTDTEALSQRI